MKQKKSISIEEGQQITWIKTYKGGKRPTLPQRVTFVGYSGQKGAIIKMLQGGRFVNRVVNLNNLTQISTPRIRKNKAA